MSHSSIADRVINFRVGADLFAADILAVERVLRYEQPRIIPDTPSWVAGVIEFQGHVVPVIDMRRRFELSESDITSQTRLVVFAAHGEYVAAIVDAVLDVRPAQEMAAAPSMFRGLSGELLHGLARRGGELVLVLNTEKLLSTQERLTLERQLAPHVSD